MSKYRIITNQDLTDNDIENIKNIPNNTGNVSGPNTSVMDNFVSFGGTTGKSIKDSGKKVSDFATSAQGALADTAVQSETDPVFTAWDKSTGISITESQISDFGTYEPADASILKEADIGVTIAPALGADDNYVTDAEKTAIGNIKGYTMNGYNTISSPLDSTTYYFGSSGYAISTVAGYYRFKIPKAGTIKTVIIESYYAGTQPTSETSVVNLKVNGGNDVLVLNNLRNNTLGQSFGNTSLNVSVAYGDSVEFNWITPAWATNPGTSVTLKTTLYIE